MSDIASLSQQIRDLNTSLGGRLDGMSGEVRTMGKEVGVLGTLVARIEERDKASSRDIDELKRDVAGEVKARLDGEEKTRVALEKVAIPLWKLLGGVTVMGVVGGGIVTFVARLLGH